MNEATQQVMPNFLLAELKQRKRKHIKSMESYLRRRARKVLGTRDLGFDVKIMMNVATIDTSNPHSL